MSTLLVLEQRKHDLRVDLVRARRDDNMEAAQKVFHKLRQVQSEIVATELYFGVEHNLLRA
jgi:hypothetical protein